MKRVRSKSNDHTILDMVCRLPLVMWDTLIFPHLNLDELAYMQRVCRGFAQSRHVKQRIQCKAKAIFGPLKRNAWNRIHLRIAILHPSSFQDMQCAYIYAKNGFVRFMSTPERLVCSLYRYYMSKLLKTDPHNFLIVFLYNEDSHVIEVYPQNIFDVFLCVYWYGLELWDIYRYRHLCPYPALRRQLEEDVHEKHYTLTPTLYRYRRE